MVRSYAVPSLKADTANVGGIQMRFIFGDTEPWRKCLTCKKPYSPRWGKTCGRFAEAYKQATTPTR